MPHRHLAGIPVAIAAAASLAPLSRADLATIEASLNATLYESATGSLANGGGEWFFAGTNNQGLRRRGLISFDLAAFAGSLGGAEIEIHSVSLELALSQGGGAVTAIDLHRVLAAWGEGSSDAPGNEGGGAAATPGSATWLHTFHADSFWATPGGDFASAVSASLTLGDNGSYSVSSEGLRQDVLAWLAGASGNFGWILLGDESELGTARRFDSRRNAASAGHPRLVIDYSVVPAPAAAMVLAALGAAAPRRRRG